MKKLGIPSSMEFHLHFTEQLCTAELNSNIKFTCRERERERKVVVIIERIVRKTFGCEWECTADRVPRSDLGLGAEDWVADIAGVAVCAEGCTYV